MKILHVHKYYYRRGGDAVVFLDTAKLMEQAGHQSAYFSMNHPSNMPSEYSRYFVSSVDLNNVQGYYRQMKTAARILYSVEAKRKISTLVRDFKPDIAHLHNIGHQLSPSIIDALKSSGIPTVMTLHDYNLTCPAYTLIKADGELCEQCGGGRYYRVIVNRCVKNSRLKSSLCAAEMYLHHTILKIYEKVDRFISPSKFLITQTRKMGFTSDISYIPNFVNINEYAPAYDGAADTILYFGRLSREKGVDTLIEAMQGLAAVKLKIIGDGPLSDRLRRKVSEANMKNVSFLGYLSGSNLTDEIKKALFIVIPSEWYENNPRSVLESFALGKAVLGARIGGIPELIEDGVTGMTFAAGDMAGLRQCIGSMTENAERTQEMGRKARILVENKYGSSQHYDALMKIYRSILM